MLKRSELEGILNGVNYDDILLLLTDQLKDMAKKSDWPQNIINALSVKIDDAHNLHIDYPKELATEIEDLEYGTPGQLPNSVIRSFIYRAPDTLSSFIEQDLLSSLLYETGVM